MNPINPIIYLSFHAELFPDAEATIRQRFEQSPLAALGFKLHFSPCCLKTSPIDLKKIGAHCRLSTLFVALLKDAPQISAEFAEVQKVELASVFSEIGITPLVAVPAHARPPAELTRVLNQYGYQTHQLARGADGSEIVAQLESLLLNAMPEPPQSHLPLTGNALYQRRRSEPLSAIEKSLLAAPHSAASGAQAELHTHQNWALQNLEAENDTGAERNLRHCLALFDADLMANYWLCRLLAKNADKDSQHQELLWRSEMLLRLNQLSASLTPELVTEIKLLQAEAHLGLREPAKALRLLENSQALTPSAQLWETLTLAGLQHLAQSEQPLQRKDPTLIHCKRSLLQLSAAGLEAFQAALIRLYRQVAKEKLELILLGVRHDLVAHLKAIKQHEHTLLTSATDWGVIVPGQSATLEQSTVLGKSLWSQATIAKQSGHQQLTLLQLLAADLLKQQQSAEHHEQQLTRHQSQSQALQDWISQAQADFAQLSKKKKQQQQFAIGMLLVALVSLSGFWWLPLNNTVNAAIFGGLVIVSALFGHGWQSASNQLKQLQAECVEQDQHYQLEQDELPEPRSFNGWFDRLKVRQEKLDTATKRATSLLKRSELLLKARCSEYLMLLTRFEEQMLNHYPELLHGWQADSQIAVQEVASDALPLPEILQAYATEPFQAERLGLVGRDSGKRCAAYFEQEIDAERVKRLHPIKRKAANMLQRAMQQKGAS